MNRRIILVFAALTAICALASASADLQRTSCRKYYKFGSAEVALSIDKPSYAPGETVFFKGSVKNTNTFPVTEGKVRVQFFYVGKDGADYMLDEFFAAEGMYLGPNETKVFGGVWDIPQAALTGTYTIEAYYTIDEFNLAGVSFLRNMMANRVSFKVLGGADLVYLDAAKIQVNKVNFSQTELFQARVAGNPVLVNVPLVNKGSATVADITYELYAWDDLRGDFLMDSRKQHFNLSAESETALAYKTPKLAAGAYLIKITAKTAKNTALLKMRVPVGGKRAKLNFLGIDKFPIKKGDNVTVFLCASNTADYTFPVYSNISVSLSDAGGRKIFSASANRTSISPNIDGFKASFTSPKDYDNVTLLSELSDESGNKEYVDLVYELKKPLVCPQDVRVCPDGSLVGRSPPRCEFAECPPPVQLEQPAQADGSPFFVIAVVLIGMALVLLYLRRSERI